MKVDFLSQAGKLLKEKKQYRRRAVVFLCLAVIVGYGTVMALKLYGQAMTHKMEVLDCSLEVHEHTEACYEKDEAGNPGEGLICGYADYVVHVHNDKCYSADGKLTCTLEERKAHEHTDECYVTETILICGEEAADISDGEVSGATDGSEPGNTGTITEDTGTAAETQSGTGDSEATEETQGSLDNAEGAAPAGDTGNAADQAVQELSCGIEAHKHTEECYDNIPVCGYVEEHAHEGNCIVQELVCPLDVHTHAEECCDVEGNVVCGMEEHTHIIGCYNGKGEVICGAEPHTHQENCYDADGNVICGMEKHGHIAGCYKEVYACGKEEHIHEEECYTASLICEKEEHEHIDACYSQAAATVGVGTDTEGGAEGSVGVEDNAEISETENGDLSGNPDPAAGSMPQENTPESGTAVESTHVHTDACYQEVTRLVCGELELHTHDDSCYGEECFHEDGTLIEGSVSSCGLFQLEEHVHQGDCFKEVELTPEEVAALNNGAILHIHEESCYDGEGNLICGHDATHIHSLECYDEAGKLICDYGKQEETTYDCGKEEHTHGDECLDEDGSLTCELEEHTHDETCKEEQEAVYYCGKEEHEHGGECYDGDGSLTCELEEHTHDAACQVENPVFYCGKEEHTHGEECLSEKGNLVCEKEEHTHNAVCLVEDPVFYCEKEEHTHGEECLDEEGNLTCELQEHIHDETCLEEPEAVYYCKKEEHIHGEDCLDEDGNQTCGLEEHSHFWKCLVTEEEYAEIENVNQLIAALPSEEEIMAKIAEYDKAGEEGKEAFTEYMESLLVQIQEAYSAYLDLDEELQEYVTGAGYLLTLWELMGTSGMVEKPEGVPEWAGFFPIGEQGGGVVLELLYGDKQTHKEKPEGEKHYSHEEMFGNFKIYTTGISGTIDKVDEVTISLYIPQKYVKKEGIRILGIPETLIKHEISEVTEVTKDGEDYYKIGLKVMDYIPTLALELPFAMTFKNAEVPKDYELKIFATIEAGEAELPGITEKNVYCPKYDEPEIIKYVNTNQNEAMKEDYTRVAAKVVDGVVESDQYVSFWYKIGNEAWQLRGYEKITLTDVLPKYIDQGGKEQIAVFDPEVNPGWELSQDEDGSTVVKRTFQVEPDWKPIDYDSLLMNRIMNAELKLSFPGCKIDEEQSDGFLTKNLTNKVKAVCEPVRPSEGEQPDKCEDDLIFTLTNQPGAKGSFAKGNSADTIMDTPAMRAGEYRWELAFKNNDVAQLVNIHIEDKQIDERLKFQYIRFPDGNQGDPSDGELIKNLDYVEAVTYDGQIDKYDLSDKEKYADYFTKGSFQYGSYWTNPWTLELDPSKEYKSFKVYFKEGFSLGIEKGIKVWPISTFRKPEEKHFIGGAENDLKNVYENVAVVDYQVKDVPETTIFLTSKNKFKLIDTYENIWIEKQMHSANMEYPGTTENPDGTLTTKEIINYCYFYVKGALKGDKEYEDLRVIDLLPEALELRDGRIEFGTGGEYVRDVDTIENYHNSGRTAVILYLNVDKVREVLDASDGTNGILFTLKVWAKANASVGQYINNAYLLSDDFDEPPVDHGRIQDEYNLDGKGTDKWIRWSRGEGNILAPAAVYAEKFIAKEGSNDWKKAILRFGIGDKFQYKLRIKNILTTPLENLQVYDVLPENGDRSINNKAERGSEFTVKLSGPITGIPAGYSVYYTNSQDVYSKAMNELLTADNIWVEQSAVDSWEEITAFKFVAQEETKVLGNESVEFIIPVKITDSLSEESSEILEQKEGEDRDTGTAVYLEATNSFGYSTGTFVSAENLESNYVKAQISFAGFVIQKMDDRGVSLSGAEFALERLQNAEQTAGGTNPENDSTAGQGAESENAGDTGRNQEWMRVAAVTTDAEGIASYKNLAEGTYRLVETKAPEGYKLLEEPIMVTITLDRTTMEYRIEAAGLEGSGTSKNPFVIINEVFYELPETGGSGFGLYTMAGAALTIFGAGFLYKKKFRERRARKSL